MSPKCDEYRSRLAPAIMRELSSIELEEVEAHVAECGECAGEMDLLSQALKGLSAWEEAPIPRPFFVSAESPVLLERLRRLPFRRLAAVGAPMFVLALAALLAWSGFQARMENGVLSLGFGAGAGAAFDQPTPPVPEQLSASLSRAVDERIQVHEGELAQVIEVAMATLLSDAESRHRALLTVALSEQRLALSEQRQRLEELWLDRRSEIEFAVRGLMADGWGRFNDRYQGDLEAVASLLDHWALDNLQQQERMDTLSYALLQLSNGPSIETSEQREVQR